MESVTHLMYMNLKTKRMSNNKQSSVEWLCERLALKLGTPMAISFYIDHAEEIEQAKAMHKKEHENTWIDSRIEDKGDDHIGKHKSFDEYYNETFNIR